MKLTQKEMLRRLNEYDNPTAIYEVKHRNDIQTGTIARTLTINGQTITQGIDEVKRRLEILIHERGLNLE